MNKKTDFSIFKQFQQNLKKNNILNLKTNIICKSSHDSHPEFVKKNDLFASSVKNTKGIQNSQNLYTENRNARQKLFSSLNFQNKSSTNKNSSFLETSKQQVVSITYEEIGLFPRSFNRVFDRFFKQLFFDVENLVIQEYRFYRYLFLTTVKCLFILIFVPLGIHFLAKNYLIRPVTEYYWNTHNHEIFLNSYQQKRAFTELKNFEEKIYFESLLFSENQVFFGISENKFQKNLVPQHSKTMQGCDQRSQLFNQTKKENDIFSSVSLRTNSQYTSFDSSALLTDFLQSGKLVTQAKQVQPCVANSQLQQASTTSLFKNYQEQDLSIAASLPLVQTHRATIDSQINKLAKFSEKLYPQAASITTANLLQPNTTNLCKAVFFAKTEKLSSIEHTRNNSKKFQQEESLPQLFSNLEISTENPNFNKLSSFLFLNNSFQNLQEQNNSLILLKNQQRTEFNHDLYMAFTTSIQKRLQMKIFELANHYNEESIEAITNFFADVLSFSSLFFLLVRLEIQINITKSFLLEVFFGLDDSKKSLLILFITDLLVGYHSPNIWELFFQTLFDHYGLPESQTTIFLLVATLPVLLDVLFKYLIFRHLNRASPATVATYHAMIE